MSGHFLVCLSTYLKPVLKTQNSTIDYQKPNTRYFSNTVRIWVFSHFLPVFVWGGGGGVSREGKWSGIVEYSSKQLLVKEIWT